MTIDPLEIGSNDDSPPISEKPYKIVFEANRCIGAGHCAVASANWDVSLETGVARPVSYFISESELAHNVEAAIQCPAKKGDGVIHVIDRRTGREIAPDPMGDGMPSLDW